MRPTWLTSDSPRVLRSLILPCRDNCCYCCFCCCCRLDGQTGSVRCLNFFFSFFLFHRNHNRPVCKFRNKEKGFNISTAVAWFLSTRSVCGGGGGVSCCFLTRPLPAFLLRVCPSFFFSSLVCPCVCSSVWFSPLCGFPSSPPALRPPVDANVSSFVARHPTRRERAQSRSTTVVGSLAGVSVEHGVVVAALRPIGPLLLLTKRKRGMCGRSRRRCRGTDRREPDTVG